MKRPLWPWFLAFLFLFIPAGLGAQSSADYDAARIESDTTFDIPGNRVEEVWAFLEERFANDPQYLQDLDPGLSAQVSDELFIDTYFDTAKLDLLGNGMGLRYRRRTNRSNPDDRKNGRELIQLKFGTVQNETLSRQEFKYPIEPPEIINSYNDLHPFLRWLSKTSRAEVSARLATIGVDTQNLRPIFTLRQRRRRIAITRDGQPFIGFSLDGSDIRRVWAKVHFDQMELELNEVTYTEGDSALRDKLIDLRRKMVSDLLAKFPDLVENVQSKYEKGFILIEQRIPWYRRLVRVGIF